MSNKIRRRNRKRLVKMSRLDWDQTFYNDVIYGNGFIISEPAEAALDDGKEKAMYGAQSPLYGTNFSDEQAFIERYRCKCGDFQGRQFEGQICPKCHTKIEYKDSDITVTGWITFGRDKIINPYYFNLLSNTIGKNIFADMVFAKYEVTTDGERRRISPNNTDTPMLSPYTGIGIEEFYKNFESIMTYFKSKKKNKASSIDIIIKEKYKVFTSVVPIYSTLLRPQSVTSDTFYYTTIDKVINTLFNLSEDLKDCEDIERDFVLKSIQIKVNSLWDIAFNMLSGKDGFIRGQVLGGSLNYTARNVIIPEPTLKDNTVDLSYHTGLELFKYKIIYYLMKLDDIPLAKAYAIWRNAYHFDEKVYDIMTFIINHDDNVRILINRNPTLAINNLGW